MKKKLGFLLLMAGLLFLIFYGCASLENIESGKIFRDPFYGFADPSIPIEQHSIVVNLAKDQTGSKQYSNPNYRARGEQNIITNPMYITKEYKVTFNVRSINDKRVKIAPSKITDFFLNRFLDLYDIVLLPPGEYTFDVAGQLWDGGWGGLQWAACTENLLPGEIYIVTATGNVTTNLSAYSPFNLLGISASIKIADPAQEYSRSEKEIITMESVIRGINASIARTRN